MTTEWFYHDLSAPDDLKFKKLRMECGYEGIGVYWTILPIIGNTDARAWPIDDIPVLATMVGLPIKKLQQFINIFVKLKLFEIETGFLRSNGLITRMKSLDDSRARMKEAGRIGGRASAQIRSNRQLQATIVQPSMVLPYMVESVVERSLNGASTMHAQPSLEFKKEKEINNKEKLSNGNPNSQNFQNPESQNLKAETSQIQKKIKTEVRVPKTTKSIADLMPIPKKPIETDHPNDNPFEDVRDDDQIFD